MVGGSGTLDGLDEVELNAMAAEAGAADNK
jgi:hypothetical protein